MRPPNHHHSEDHNNRSHSIKEKANPHPIYSYHHRLGRGQSSLDYWYPVEFNLLTYFPSDHHHHHQSSSANEEKVDYQRNETNLTSAPIYLLAWRSGKYVGACHGEKHF